MRKDKFRRELDMIISDDIRIFGEIALDGVPEYFFTTAASSSGKYHPSYALGDGGLVRHTCAAIRFAHHLFQLEQFQNQFSQREQDLTLVAIMLHDSWKHGDKGSKHTVFEHPQVAADWIRGNELFKELLSSEERELVATAIESHMGQWNTSRKAAFVLEKPKSKIQKFVHMCDYLASRKDLEVQFEDYVPLEIPDLDSYRLDFGKYKGEKLIDIAKKDEWYIGWLKENYSKEPVYTLLKKLAIK